MQGEVYQSERMKRLITGAWGKDENIVAFCCYKRHKGYITRKQRKEHKCLRKHCKCYISLKKMEKERS